MRLPAKFLPRQSQHIGNIVGAVLVILFGLVLLSGYLPAKPVTGQQISFGQWLGESGAVLPFMLIAIAVVLFGLVGLSIALVNLLCGSPFNHLILDRFGLRIRTLFSEKFYSWKELGPIRPLRLGLLRAYSLDRRFWIVSDTFSGEARNDTRRPITSFNLRIPMATYLGSSWVGGNVEAALDQTAAWLESLRKLAHAETLNPDDVPDAPEMLGSGVPAAPEPTSASASAPAKTGRKAGTAETDLPAMADRKFGRRSDPTIER